ncbi:WD repeat-containing protein 34 [Sparganum proliferum]
MVLIDQLTLQFDIVQERSHKTLASNFSQTDRYTIVHRGNQSKRFRHAPAQTDDCLQTSEHPQGVQAHTAGLVTFLDRVAPIVCEQLDRNSKSSVWRNAQAADIVNDVEPFAQTVHFDQATNFEHSVTCVAWNTFGTIFAVSYPFCYSNNLIDQIRSEAPDYVFETNSCVNCVVFRPQHSSILACGTFSGELMIWTLADELGSLVASRGGASGGHQDAINHLHWFSPESVLLGTSKSGQCGANEHLVSFGADGRIICWTLTMDSREPTLTPIKIYQICGRDQLGAAVQDRLYSVTPLGGTEGSPSTSLDHPLGITTAVFSPQNQESLLIGTESGGLLCCRFDVVDWGVPKIGN